MSRNLKSICLLACLALCTLGVSRADGLPGDDDEELNSLRASYRSKYWTFIDRSSGDCHLTGVLTIFDNGRAVWAATSSTDHTNFADIWHESIQVFDSKDQPLFGFGVWDSPGMRADGNFYFWKAHGEFPKALFDAADKAAPREEC